MPPTAGDRDPHRHCAIGRQMLDPALERSVVALATTMLTWPLFLSMSTDMLVFCFADRTHAEQFCTRVGGEFIDPKARPRWPGSRR
jgi:hypothetical protein